MKLIYKTNAYATHQPVLIEVVRLLKKDSLIIELGTGEGSTNLLHSMANELGHDIISLDSDFDWLNKYKELWPGYDFRLGDVKYLEESLSPLKCVPGLVFVDQGDWTARRRSIEYWSNRSHYIVAHDSDGYADYKDQFMYHKEFAVPGINEDLPNYIPGFCGPPTLVLSNHHPIDIYPDWEKEEWP